MKRVPLLAIATSLLSPARIDAQARFETIYEFASLPDGSAPQGLAEGPKGGHRAQRRRRHLWSHHIWRILGPRHCLRPRLYGMTAYGGSANYGTVFQLTPPASHAGRWSESILFEFTNPNYGGGGTNPFSAPVVGKDGSIYGATGGISVIFQLQPPATTGGTWTETVLYPTSEDYPAAGFTHGLIVGPNGELYAAASFARALLIHRNRSLQFHRRGRRRPSLTTSHPGAGPDPWRQLRDLRHHRIRRIGRLRRRLRVSA